MDDKNIKIITKVEFSLVSEINECEVNMLETKFLDKYTK